MTCVACKRNGTVLTHGAFCPTHWQAVPLFIRRRLTGETSPAVVFALVKAGADYIKRNVRPYRRKAA